MESAAFSTGVSIQYPRGGAGASSAKPHHGVKKFPFPFPADARVQQDKQYRSDTEAYRACQELAYRFACERARDAVQELLRKSNDTSYSQVLRFFEKFRAGHDEQVKTAPSPSGRRDPNAPVVFPQFHAFPTAAVIAGTDATSSDLWVQPLTLKLRRTFPLCLVVHRDVATARRLVEWLAARMEKLCAAKKREEKWLGDMVDNFDLLPLDQPPVASGGIGSRTRHRCEQTKREKAKAAAQDEEQSASDASEFSSFSESSSDPDTDEELTRVKRKRRVPSVLYGRWTMSKLLTTIQRDADELMSPTSGDICRELVDILCSMVQDRLAEALAAVRNTQVKEGDVIVTSIACFAKAETWLRRKIQQCQEEVVKLLNVAPDSNSSNPATVHISSTEMTLARTLQRVLHQYASFLNDCKLNLAVVQTQRKSIKQKVLVHENRYTLKSDRQGPQVQAVEQNSDTPRPFLLLCIEQLETFSQQVLGDFLEIWTHFVRQQQEERLPASETNCTLGFVVGVASATSPALRRLDLTVTNRLELQFFSLVDSRKCFDDVLEELVVKAKLPFAVSGEVLRAVAKRHHRLPSVPRLLLALRFLLFTHFRRHPWSFLALTETGLSSSGMSPILVAADVTPLPSRVSDWVKRLRRRLTREGPTRAMESGSDLTSWIAPCGALELHDLRSRVMKSSGDTTDGADDWLAALEAALLNERRRQARWRMGWRCFRSACTWLDVRMDGGADDKQEHLTVVHLALALEGRLGEAPCLMEVLQRLQNCSRWAALLLMIEDWRSCYRAFSLTEDDGDDLEITLSELAMLCAYARSEKSPEKMYVALREEIVTVFTSRLISSLLYSSAPKSRSSADVLVANWSVLTDANVLEERLRFEYHDNLRNVLQDAGIGEDIDTNGGGDAQASWVHDVGLAFLFYQENASASLSLREWYDSFSSELKEESKASSSKKRKKSNSNDDAAIKARFVRAVCTLRHWGFLRSDAPRDSEQDIIEKLVFI
ncbi:unnamed protein product [Phytophthora lilii]|uniref:Unnamed protein product n=1 Tax=Phytophthora lilii TaxID=2077276 RepID=A0A9W6WS07_9STRA|nr:unnamed protein product [Phytophthora lilii]